MGIPAISSVNFPPKNILPLNKFLHICELTTEMTGENLKRNYWETSREMNDLILLTAFIKKHVWVFTCICVILFGASAFFYQKHTAYTSRITFLVNSSNLAEVLWDRSADGPIEVVNDDRGYDRINQIMYSSQMIDYLIEKFNLYTHYNVDKNDVNSYMVVATRIKENIKISISKTKIITVQVSDRLDYNVASNIANAVGKKINDINRQITVESLTRKTEIFETLSKDLRLNSQREFSQMDSLFKNMQRVISTSIKDEGYRQLLIMHMENLETNSEKYFKDLFESYKYRLFSMYSLQEKNLPTISVLERALPNKASKSVNNVIFYPIIIILSILVPIFFAYMLIKCRPVLSYLFRQTPETNQVK